MPVYKAIADGTLSNPYRHIEKGQKITSDKPIKASWLKEIIDGKEPVIEELPVANYVERAQHREPLEKPVAAISESYQNGIDSMIAYEQKVDALKNASGEGAAAPSPQPSEAGEDSVPSGSGDQDVI